MRKPFDKSTNKAFEVFFSDNRIVCLLLNGQAKKNVSIECAVMEDVSGEGIMDDSMDSDGRQYNIIVGLENCQSLEHLRRGDRLVTCDNRKYSIMQVVDDQLFGKVVKARLMK